MSAAARLDAFTDAAFAFAISLMVVGTGGGTPDFQGLVQVMRFVPSFAIGFAIMAMFWFAHVRWRLYRGEGDWRSVLLTFLLIFVVLIYVHPLRAMSEAFAAFLSGRGSSYGGYLVQMFTIYGVGFTIMSAIVLGLYWDALTQADLAPETRRVVGGQRIIWGILTLTGMVSIGISLIRPIAPLAPFVYATLPISIGLFASRWTWEDAA